MNFLGTVAQKALKITDKSVDVTFASCFEDDVLVVIVSVKKDNKLVSKSRHFQFSTYVDF